MRFLRRAFLITVVASGPAGAIGMGETAPEQAYIDLANNRGAYQAGRTTPDFSSVAAIGLIEDGHFELFGTGTLVAPTWLLTAAHVVVDPEDPSQLLEGLRVRFGSDINSPDTSYQVVGALTPLGLQSGAYAPFADLPEGDFTDAEQLRADFNDIALIRLDRDAADIPPAPWSPAPPTIGQRLLIAGYGEAARGSQPEEDDWTQPALRRAAENTLDRDVAIDPFTGRSDAGGVLMFDFDNGDEARNSLNALHDAYWLTAAGRGSSAAAPLPLEGSSYPGDSGGPAFAFIDGRWQIVGVSSSGSGWPISGARDGAIQFGDILVYARLASHVTWLRSILGPE